MEKEIESLLLRGYELTYRGLTGAPFYFIPTSRDEALIESFIEILREDQGGDLLSVGVNYIHDYFTFQLDYWLDKDTRFNGKIPPSWVFGKKAFSRFNNRVEHDLYHAKKTANRLGFTIDKLKGGSPTFNARTPKDTEEKEKSRYYNEPEGFVNCIEKTTLHNHRSRYCLTCVYKEECKRALKKNYPKIALLRGYLRKKSNK